MAIIPSTRYPSQIDTGDAGFPHGRARNAGSFQDGSGTPLEKDWVNDLFGLQQALLVAAGITPTGVPDKVGASQYLEAIKKIARMPPGIQTIATTGDAVITLADTTDILVIAHTVADSYLGIKGFIGGWEGRGLRIFNVSGYNHSLVQLYKDGDTPSAEQIDFNVHPTDGFGIGSTAPTIYEGMSIGLVYVASRWRPLEFVRSGIPG